MKNKHQVQSCMAEFPITDDFLDLDIVEQVVEEAFVKEPKKKQEKA